VNASTSPPAISIQGLEKVYPDGFRALNPIDLEIRSGEIFALLGPNGAGKTTLINAVCGIINLSAGRIEVYGHDIIADYRKARRRIGLVPQELHTDAFETVWNTVSFSRGLFGKKANPQLIESTLNSLALWEKKDQQIRMLSGGMKRRVMIAKALSHEPQALFLDEPTAGVDVELRKSMWDLVHELRESGVTIILTTHYIEEAEEMADRVGVINKGELIVVEETHTLMKKLGKKEMVFDLHHPLDAIPEELARMNIHLEMEGSQIVYTYDTMKENNGVTEVLDCLKAHHVLYRDISTRQSSLEEIFVDLVREP